MKFVFHLIGFALAVVIGLFFRLTGFPAVFLLAVGLFVFPPVARLFWSISARAKSRPVCDALTVSARNFLADVGAPATPANLNRVWLVFFFDVKRHLDQYNPRLAGRTFLRHCEDDFQSHPRYVTRAAHQTSMYSTYSLVEEDIRSRRIHHHFPRAVAIAMGIDSNPDLVHAAYYRRSFEAGQAVLCVLDS